LVLDDLVDFCFYGVCGLIRPLQIRSEILELLRILDRIKPDVLVEIGTYSGGTLFLLSHIASKDAKIISIDFPDVRFGGGYPWWKIPLLKTFTSAKQKLHLIRADSHKQETLAKVRSELGSKKVAALFIDGDHSYEGVKKDFEMYGPLVKDGGIIVFHDVVLHPVELGCEVKRFWDELINESKYKYIEIIDNRNQGTCGIGVLFISVERS
jgi:predicted O-methyltransferase YrrM